MQTSSLNALRMNLSPWLSTAFKILNVMTEQHRASTSTKLADVLIVLVGVAEILSLLLSVAFGWPTRYFSWLRVASTTDLLVLVRQPALYYTGFAIAAALVWVTVITATFVGNIIVSGRYAHLWALRLLRVLVVLIVTVAYIPVLRVMLIPFNCDALLSFIGPPSASVDNPAVVTDDVVGVQAAVNGDVSTSTLDEGDLTGGQVASCSHPAVLFLRIFSAMTLAVLVPGALFVRLTYFQDNPLSSSVLSRVSGRVDMLDTLVRTILTGMATLDPGQPFSLGLVAILLLSMQTAFTGVTLPYFRSITNEIMVGSYGALTWVALGGVLVRAARFYSPLLDAKLDTVDPPGDDWWVYHVAVYGGWNALSLVVALAAVAWVRYRYWQFLQLAWLVQDPARHKRSAATDSAPPSGSLSPQAAPRQVRMPMTTAPVTGPEDVSGTTTPALPPSHGRRPSGGGGGTSRLRRLSVATEGSTEGDTEWAEAQVAQDSAGADVQDFLESARGGALDSAGMFRNHDRAVSRLVHGRDVTSAAGDWGRDAQAAKLFSDSSIAAATARIVFGKDVSHAAAEGTTAVTRYAAAGAKVLPTAPGFLQRPPSSTGDGRTSGEVSMAAARVAVLLDEEGGSSGDEQAPSVPISARSTSFPAHAASHESHLPGAGRTTPYSEPEAATAVVFAGEAKATRRRPSVGETGIAGGGVVTVPRSRSLEVRKVKGPPKPPPRAPRGSKGGVDVRSPEPTREMPARRSSTMSSGEGHPARPDSSLRQMAWGVGGGGLSHTPVASPLQRKGGPGRSKVLTDDYEVLVPPEGCCCGCFCCCCGCGAQYCCFWSISRLLWSAGTTLHWLFCTCCSSTVDYDSSMRKQGMRRRGTGRAQSTATLAARTPKVVQGRAGRHSVTAQALIHQRQAGKGKVERDCCGGKWKGAGHVTLASIVDQYWLFASDVELMSRMLLSPAVISAASIAQADVVFRAGLNVFPSSIFLRLARSTFILLHRASGVEAVALLMAAKRLSRTAAMDLQFQLFTKLQSWRSVKQAAELGEALDSISIMQFEQLFTQARDNHLQAVGALATMWHIMHQYHETYMVSEGVPEPEEGATPLPSAIIEEDEEEQEEEGGDSGRPPPPSLSKSSKAPSQGTSKRVRHEASPPRKSTRSRSTVGRRHSLDGALAARSPPMTRGRTLGRKASFILQSPLTGHQRQLTSRDVAEQLVMQMHLALAGGDGTGQGGGAASPRRPGSFAFEMRPSSARSGRSALSGRSQRSLRTVRALRSARHARLRHERGQADGGEGAAAQAAAAMRPSQRDKGPISLDEAIGLAPAEEAPEPALRHPRQSGGATAPQRPPSPGTGLDTPAEDVEEDEAVEALLGASEAQSEAVREAAAATVNAQLAELLHVIHTCTTKADSAYVALIKTFPSSPVAMKSYGLFLLHVVGDTDLAHRVLDKAYANMEVQGAVERGEVPAHATAFGAGGGDEATDTSAFDSHGEDDDAHSVTSLLLLAAARRGRSGITHGLDAVAVGPSGPVAVVQGQGEGRGMMGDWFGHSSDTARHAGNTRAAGRRAARHPLASARAWLTGFITALALLAVGTFTANEVMLTRTQDTLDLTLDWALWRNLGVQVTQHARDVNIAAVEAGRVGVPSFAGSTPPPAFSNNSAALAVVEARSRLLESTEVFLRFHSSLFRAVSEDGAGGSDAVQTDVEEQWVEPLRALHVPAALSTTVAASLALRAGDSSPAPTASGNTSLGTAACGVMDDLALLQVSLWDYGNVLGSHALLLAKGATADQAAPALACDGANTGGTPSSTSFGARSLSWALASRNGFMGREARIGGVTAAFKARDASVVSVAVISGGALVALGVLCVALIVVVVFRSVLTLVRYTRRQMIAVVQAVPSESVADLAVKYRTIRRHYMQLAGTFDTERGDMLEDVLWGLDPSKLGTSIDLSAEDGVSGVGRGWGSDEDGTPVQPVDGGGGTQQDMCIGPSTKRYVSAIHKYSDDKGLKAAADMSVAESTAKHRQSMVLMEAACSSAAAEEGRLKPTAPPEEKRGSSKKLLLRHASSSGRGNVIKTAPTGVSAWQRKADRSKEPKAPESKRDSAASRKLWDKVSGDTLTAVRWWMCVSVIALLVAVVSSFAVSVASVGDVDVVVDLTSLAGERAAHVISAATLAREVVIGDGAVVSPATAAVELSTSLNAITRATRELQELTAGLNSGVSLVRASQQAEARAGVDLPSLSLLSAITTPANTTTTGQPALTSPDEQVRVEAIAFAPPQQLGVSVDQSISILLNYFSLSAATLLQCYAPQFSGARDSTLCTYGSATDSATYDGTVKLAGTNASAIASQEQLFVMDRLYHVSLGADLWRTIAADKAEFAERMNDLRSLGIGLLLANLIVISVVYTALRNIFSARLISETVRAAQLVALVPVIAWLPPGALEEGDFLAKAEAMGERSSPQEAGQAPPAIKAPPALQRPPGA